MRPASRSPHPEVLPKAASKDQWPDGENRAWRGRWLSPVLIRLFKLAARLGRRNLPDGVRNGGSVLCAHHRIFAFEQETWNAGDAHARRRGGFGRNRLAIGVGSKQAFDDRRVHAAF